MKSRKKDEGMADNNIGDYGERIVSEAWGSRSGGLLFRQVFQFGF